MGAASEHVSITVTADNVALTELGFGTAGILGYNATWPERARTYSDLDGVGDDFAATKVEYRTAQTLFSQSPKPEQVMIIRGALPPTQRYVISKLATPAAGYRYLVTADGEGVTATQVDITLLADIAISAVTNGADSFTSVAHGMTTGDGPYRLTNSGGGLPAGSAIDTDYWIIKLTADTFSIASSKANALALTAVNLTTDGTGTHTLQRDANDVLMAQLVQALNAVVGKNFTAVQTTGAGDTDVVTVTANAAGGWFSLSLDGVVTLGLLSIVQNHADPGIATDLAAIAAENKDWRTLLTNFNSDAMITAAQAWVEATEQTDYMVDSCDSLIATATSTGSADIADDMKTAAYTRLLMLFHSSPAKFLAAGTAGAFLTSEPGEADVKYTQVTGVGGMALTATHKTNLRAKYCGTLEAISGATFVWEGRVPSGTFFDVQRDDDWVKNDMQLRVLAVLLAVRKVPFTDAGIRTICNEVDATLAEAVERGIYSDYRITIPLRSEVPTIKVTNRVLPNVKWKAVRAGGIGNVEIAGNVVNGVVLV